MAYEVIHLPDQTRFEATVEGFTGFVKYRLTGDALDILHTIVPVPIEGQGVASSLVKTAYDYALDNNMRCVATCPYAVAWLERHPGYRERER